LSIINIKKAGMCVSLCCTVGYKFITVMDGVKSQFNDRYNIFVYEKRFWAKTVWKGYFILNLYYGGSRWIELILFIYNKL